MSLSVVGYLICLSGVVFVLFFWIAELKKTIWMVRVFIGIIMIINWIVIMYLMSLVVCATSEHFYISALYSASTPKTDVDTNYVFECVSEYIENKDIMILNNKLDDLRNGEN